MGNMKMVRCRNCGVEFDAYIESIAFKVGVTAVMTAFTGPFGLLFGPAISADERTCRRCQGPCCGGDV